MNIKTMKDLRNELAVRPIGGNEGTTRYYSEEFISGWDARDKLDNEALKIAVKVLRDICDYEDYEDSTFKIARYALHEIIKLGVVE